MLQPTHTAGGGVEEFFAYLNGIEGRAEYQGGVIYDMAGGEPDHSRIAGNLGGEIYSRLGDRSCSVFNSDLLVALNLSEAYFFPDLTVVCGPLERSEAYPTAITNPQIVVEVMSPSSVERDRTSKLIRYMQLPSLREYLLVDTRRPAIEVVFINDQGHWDWETVEGLDGNLNLRSLGMSIPMAKIYRLVEFG